LWLLPPARLHSPASGVASQPVNPCLRSGKDHTTPATESHAWSRRERGATTRTSIRRGTLLPSQNCHNSATGSVRTGFAVRVGATSQRCGQQLSCNKSAPNTLALGQQLPTVACVWKGLETFSGQRGSQLASQPVRLLVGVFESSCHITAGLPSGCFMPCMKA
jgi:hypothetical protein